MTKNAKEVKNPRLRTFIEMMKEENTPENRQSVLGEIVKGEFIVPVELYPKPDFGALGPQGGKLPDGTKMNICIMMNQNGQKYVPAFTDQEEVNKWKVMEGQKNGLTEEETMKEMGQYTIFTWPQYVRMVLDPKKPLEGFIINPCGDSVTIQKELIISMLEQQKKMNEMEEKNKK